MSSPVRVTMINTNRERGGAARIASSLTDDFNASGLGVEARLVHFGDRRQSDTFFGLRRDWKAYAMALQTRFVGSLDVVDFGVHRQFLREAMDADIVHLHNLHGYFVDVPALVEAVSHRPVVWTWHDMWGATGRCGLPEACDRWRQGCAPCPQKKLYPAAWIDRSASEFGRKFDLFANMQQLRIVSPSRWLADVAIERGYPSEQVVVIPNSVDDQVFRPQDREALRADLDLPGDRPVVLFIAEDHNAPRKGYQDFAAATAGLAVDAVAVGSPPKTPAGHVRHVGRIGQREVLAAYYSVADSMMIPSYADNFPTTVVESLMSGTPVIGYDVGGIPDQLSDRWSVVVPEGDKAALRRSVESLIQECGRYREARHQIAAMARERWSKKAVMAAYMDVYEGLLATTASRG